MLPYPPAPSVQRSICEHGISVKKEDVERLEKLMLNTSVLKCSNLLQEELTQTLIASSLSQKKENKQLSERNELLTRVNIEQAEENVVLRRDVELLTQQVSTMQTNYAQVVVDPSHLDQQYRTSDAYAIGMDEATFLMWRRSFNVHIASMVMRPDTHEIDISECNRLMKYMMHGEISIQDCKRALEERYGFKLLQN